jgi:hypothetical protein
MLAAFQDEGCRAFKGLRGKGVRYGALHTKAYRGIGERLYKDKAVGGASAAYRCNAVHQVLMHTFHPPAWRKDAAYEGGGFSGGCAFRSWQALLDGERRHSLSYACRYVRHDAD